MESPRLVRVVHECFAKLERMTVSWPCRQLLISGSQVRVLLHPPVNQRLTSRVAADFRLAETLSSNDGSLFALVWVARREIRPAVARPLKAPRHAGAWSCCF